MGYLQLIILETKRNMKECAECESFLLPKYLAHPNLFFMIFDDYMSVNLKELLTLLLLVFVSLTFCLLL